VIQPRFLVPLGGHQEKVDVVLVAVLPKQLHDGHEFLALCLRGGIPRVGRADQVLPFDLIPEGGAEPILAHEPIERGFELWIVLADGDAKVAAGTNRNVLLQDDAGEDLFQNLAR
jgi:hypothetical protein